MEFPISAVEWSEVKLYYVAGDNRFVLQVLALSKGLEECIYARDRNLEMKYQACPFRPSNSHHPTIQTPVKMFQIDVQINGRKTVATAVKISQIVTALNK